MYDSNPIVYEAVDLYENVLELSDITSLFGLKKFTEKKKFLKIKRGNPKMDLIYTNFKGYSINNKPMYIPNWATKHEKKFPILQMGKYFVWNGKEYKGSPYYYEGQYLNGYKYGYGVWFSIEKEEFYEGEWKNDKRHGWGFAINKNGEANLGRFENDVFQGYCLTISNNRQIIEGIYKPGPKNNLDGVCVVYNSNGRIIEKGFYKNQFLNGFGCSFDTDNNEFYQGYWVNGLKSGQGIFQKLNNSEEHLLFKKQMEKTQAKEHQKFFEFLMEKNYSNPTGIFYKYLGNWTDNKKDGYGELRNGYNFVLRGFWNKGKLKGQCVYNDSDFCVEEWQIVNDKIVERSKMP